MWGKIVLLIAYYLLSIAVDILYEMHGSHYITQKKAKSSVSAIAHHNNVLIGINASLICCSFSSQLVSCSAAWNKNDTINAEIAKLLCHHKD